MVSLLGQDVLHVEELAARLQHTLDFLHQEDNSFSQNLIAKIDKVDFSLRFFGKKRLILSATCETKG